MQYNNFNINNISLEKDEHVYTLENSNIKFTSVTSFISEFFEEFDSLKIATKLVNKVPKYAAFTVEELLNKWRGAAEHGTRVHNEIEEYILNNARPKETKAIHGINWLEKFLDNEKHTVYTEKIIYSEELRLAGSVDLIIKNKLTNEYTIIDWKTNEKIPTTSYNKKMGTHLITSDIEDCKYSVYSLQLSLYRYILEKYYGLQITRQFIVHLKDNEVLAYLVPYLNKHVNQFADLRKGKNEFH